jgi:hypothetical protein
VGVPCVCALVLEGFPTGATQAIHRSSDLLAQAGAALCVTVPPCSAWSVLRVACEVC